MGLTRKSLVEVVNWIVFIVVVGIGWGFTMWLVTPGKPQ